MRFTIRDLLWLTLVVAMALGWLVRERQLRVEGARFQAEASRERDRATKWRGAAGALERLLSEEGWKVKWDLPASYVTAEKEVEFATSKSGRRVTSGRKRSTDQFEPSAKDD